MWAEIARLAADEQLTVLLTTHYLDEADHLADRLAIVDHGRVVVEGTPDELKSRLRGDGVVVEVADQAAGAVARRTPFAPRRARRRHPRGPGASGPEPRRPPRVIPGVLAALDQAGVAVELGDRRPTELDDVYLHHAGRTLRGGGADR